MVKSRIPRGPLVSLSGSSTCQKRSLSTTSTEHQGRSCECPPLLQPGSCAICGRDPITMDSRMDRSRTLSTDGNGSYKSNCSIVAIKSGCVTRFTSENRLIPLARRTATTRDQPRWCNDLDLRSDCARAVTRVIIYVLVRRLSYPVDDDRL